MVMELCRKHLRGVCGNALDSFKGDNYEVLIIQSNANLFISDRIFVIHLSVARFFGLPGQIHPLSQIINDDCISVLEAFAREGRHFDFVINDLTAVPVSKTREGESWNSIQMLEEC